MMNDPIFADVDDVIRETYQVLGEDVPRDPMWVSVLISLLILASVAGFVYVMKRRYNNEAPQKKKADASKKTQ